MESEGSGQRIPPKPYLDQPAINYTPSQIASSYAGSMSGFRNHGEDAQSKASAYTSYTADEDRQVRRERRRDFNILSDAYSLPRDIEEWNRLDKQHRAVTLGLGGLYPAPEIVHAVLAPQDGVFKKIVDLGCGTGLWAMEVAREFPHCEVLGIDLAPVPLTPRSLPPNCRFEMDDINLGLAHLQGQFDLVFARSIDLSLRDFRKSLADITSYAKPGGIVIWVDGDFDLYSGWPMVYRPFWSSSNPDGSYAGRVLYELRRSASLGVSDVKTMERVLDEGLWSQNTVLGPDTCKAASMYLPIGTWCGHGDTFQREQLKYIGMLLRQDIRLEQPRSHSSPNQAGPKRPPIGAARMKQECQSDTSGIRARIVWGRRREGPGLPAPPLPLVPSASAEGGSSMNAYPFYEIFHTQEQAVAAAIRRNRDKNIPAPPLASHSMQ